MVAGGKGVKAGGEIYVVGDQDCQVVGYPYNKSLVPWSAEIIFEDFDNFSNALDLHIARPAFICLDDQGRRAGLLRRAPVIEIADKEQCSQDEHKSGSFGGIE